MLKHKSGSIVKILLPSWIVRHWSLIRSLPARRRQRHHSASLKPKLVGRVYTQQNVLK